MNRPYFSLDLLEEDGLFEAARSCLTVRFLVRSASTSGATVTEIECSAGGTGTVAVFSEVLEVSRSKDSPDHGIEAISAFPAEAGALLALSRGASELPIPTTFFAFLNTEVISRDSRSCQSQSCR